MLTDTKSGSMRIALHQIYVSIYVEYVVKNPLSPVEHPGGLGVNNELFEITLEQFVVRLTGKNNLCSLEFANLTAHESVGSSTKRSVMIHMSCHFENLFSSSGLPRAHLSKIKRILPDHPKIGCYAKSSNLFQQRPYCSLGPGGGT